MARLLDYEEAQTEKARALAAIEVARHKSSKRLAWTWADRAIEHAEKAGIEDAGYLVADGRYPVCTELEERLRSL